MIWTCKNAACGKKFTVAKISGGWPGGKEMETVDCPHCHEEQHREMTSSSFSVRPVDEGEAKLES